MKYVVIEYTNGNGFEDDEGVLITSATGFNNKADGVAFLKQKFEEVKEMMNNEVELVDKFDYRGFEGEVYFEDNELVYRMESEGGFVLKEIV